jgi:hypothetical protein
MPSRAPSMRSSPRQTVPSRSMIAPVYSTIRSDPERGRLSSMPCGTAIAEVHSTCSSVAGAFRAFEATRDPRHRVSRTELRGSREFLSPAGVAPVWTSTSCKATSPPNAPTHW